MPQNQSNIKKLTKAEHPCKPSDKLKTDPLLHHFPEILKNYFDIEKDMKQKVT